MENPDTWGPVEKDYCQGFEDGIDGFAIHSPECVHYQNTSASSNRCVNFKRNCAWPKGLRDIR